MKTRLSRFIALPLVACAFVFSAFAGSYTTSSGQSYEGELYKILEGEVYLTVGEDKVNVPISDFNAASQDAIKAWAEQHPESVEVYIKWDKQPRIKSSVLPHLPEQFHDPEFKGMVSVDLVLDESGQVIHASIKKSTHSGLEEPSLEAARTWLFEPAEVGGAPVKSKLRVPFKFVYTPKQPEGEPAG